jgi:Rieske Fe-S protein
MAQSGPGNPVTSPLVAEQLEEISTRRRVMKDLIAFSVGAFALAFALPALAIKSLSLEKKAVAAGDALVYATGEKSGQPVIPSDLSKGDGIQVFPNGNNQPDALVELVRIGDGDDITAFAAFSAICTHLGCTVYAKLDGEGHISCPCHGSQFDPNDGARVVSGPAARALPSLPIKIGDDGSIAVDGAFSGPIGVQ